MMMRGERMYSLVPPFRKMQLIFSSIWSTVRHSSCTTIARLSPCGMPCSSASSMSSRVYSLSTWIERYAVRVETTLKKMPYVYGAPGLT